ncbi:uncharacterized protein LOC124367574 isoform X3 [Homalodisca vitripennis]|uniref:uncharacterized protein LOC124367574 isoform X3 n=1 Tax=Homalodisca vitripennis TaxID=197043 RepID=UPI001EEC6AB4|nr:uncharacterized protein LOC124367574 isoform X3 [Homalodisca vitripennis]
MKYGLSKTNPPPEEDERWKTVMKNSIDFLKFEIGLLKLELQKSKLKIEELTPNYPGFQNDGTYNTDQNQFNAFSSTPSEWPSKPTVGCRPSSGWQYPTCGTKSAPYQTTCCNEFSNFKDTNQRYMCITAMEQYKNKSLEELRYEDYIARDGLKSHQFIGRNANYDPSVTASSGSNAFANPRSCFGPQVAESTGYNPFASQRSCFGPQVIGPTGSNIFYSNPRSSFGPQVAASTGYNPFANQRSCFGPQVIGPTDSNIFYPNPKSSFGPQVAASTGSNPFANQRSCFGPQVIGPTGSNIFTNPRSSFGPQVASSTGSNPFADPRSCFGPRISSTTGMNCFSDQSQNSDGAGTNSKQTIFHGFQNGSIKKPKIVDKPDCFESLIQKEVISQMISKLNKMDKYFQTINTRLTSMESHLDDVSSNMSIMVSHMSAIDMHVAMQKVDKKWKGLKTCLANLEASPQDQAVERLTFHCPADLLKEKVKTSTALESDPIEDMSVLSSTLSASKVDATEKEEMLPIDNSSNTESKLDSKSYSNLFKFNPSFGDLCYVKPVSYSLFERGSSQNNQGGALLFGCTPTKRSDSRMDISSNSFSPLSIDKSEKAKDINQKQEETNSKSALEAANVSGSKDSTECSVAGEQGCSISCIDEQDSSRESQGIILEQKENLITSKPSESVTSGVSRNLLETKSNNGHDLFITFSAPDFNNPKAPENVSFENVTSSSGLATYNSISASNQIPLETLPENKCTDKQGTTCGYQTEDVKTIKFIEMDSLSFSVIKPKDLSTPKSLGETVVVTTNTNNNQRPNVLIDPTENLKMSEGSNSPSNVTRVFETCSQYNILTDSSKENETKTEKMAAVEDQSNCLINGENESDEENGFVIVGNEQCSVLSEASTNKSTSFKAFNDITEYLEINLGKKKDVVYEFGFEVKLDSPTLGSTLETSVREGDVNNAHGDNREKDDSFNAFTSNFIANCSEKQSSPFPKESIGFGGNIKKKEEPFNTFISHFGTNSKEQSSPATNEQDK